MSEKISQQKKEARRLLDEAKKKAQEGNFAYQLTAASLESHIGELEKIELASKVSPAFEMLDFRIKAPDLKTGSAPLGFVSKLTEEVRKTLGYAALRLVQGGIDRKRVPKHLYADLDLRLEGLLPGSSRFIVSAAAERDLLDDGLSKGAIERVFSVLSSEGKGQEFLNSVNDLGPLGAKSLRNFLKIIRSHDAEADFTWTYSGEKVLHWEGKKDVLDSVTAALEVTKVMEEERVVLQGKVELLSKRERIDLRSVEGNLIKILYPKRLLSSVSELHLEQEVTLYCQVTETENPLTNESSVFYELLEIRS
ncbi:hypothetical protein HF888_08055 [Bermanella marisrubri]|uniref:Uncharacterized protein n=1 Tax=Bermanella marisrubri TaxID=207949 RepID=Q1N4J4_9GAMM|nr:hypothetical protein [Bermanella marisrubri]EAT13434.1 hypothetical protein RED65_01700 [Oceanobacter sp. RED65] [Bermanella marisrubri]QIZ84183.1 hypothetical protein HF888_08055 [Bermanella marisrubri]